MKTTDEIKKEIIQDIKSGDMGDPWGTCMSWLFTITGHLYELDPDGIPDAWRYKAGLGGGIDLTLYEDQTLAYYRTGYSDEIEEIFASEKLAEYDEQEIDEELAEFQPDALEAVRQVREILNRWKTRLELAGRDY